MLAATDVVDQAVRAGPYAGVGALVVFLFKLLYDANQNLQHVEQQLREEWAVERKSRAAEEAADRADSDQRFKDSLAAIQADTKETISRHDLIHKAELAAMVRDNEREVAGLSRRIASLEDEIRLLRTRP